MTTDAHHPRSYQRLLYRWFVQYNPTYFASAALVLVGVILTSRGLALEGGWIGPLGGEAIAEVYAFALIGAAAFLQRIGQRRPATLLALIIALYQCDLTLHTETCPLMGTLGVVAAGAWCATFMGKLALLAWALRVRITRRAWAAAALGMTILAMGPFILAWCDGRVAGVVIAVLGQCLIGLTPSPSSSVDARAPLDDWGSTVLRRMCRSIWLVWGCALVLHVGFWTTLHAIDVRYCALSALFVGITRLRSERWVWIWSVGLLALVALTVPSLLSGSLLLSAIGLMRYATTRVPCTITTSVEATPYREGESLARSTSWEPLPLATRVRAWVGACAAIHLAIWTLQYRGGPLPPHSLALDLFFAVFMIALVAKLRTRAPLVPLGALLVHAAFAYDLVPQPQTTLEWGLTALAGGFALLLSSLLVSYRLRHWRPEWTSSR